MATYLPYISIVLGLLLLVWSSDKFVDAAADLAGILKFPSFVIGMVIVGFGTSAPELLVSAQAAIEGNPGVAIGNAFGSNIANMTLILGAASIIQALKISPLAVKRDIPILIGITLFTAYLSWDLYLSRQDSIILLLLLFGVVGWQTLQARSNMHLELQEPKDLQTTNKTDIANKTEGTNKASIKSSVLWILFGLTFLLLAAKMLVWGSVLVARSFGVSDMVIGLTLVAVGTSLPELAASIAAALKKQADLAVGNIIGSNLFNTLGVLGVAGAIAPLPLESSLLTRDIPITLAITLAILLFGLQKKASIKKWQASILILVFFAFQTSLFLFD